jgi:hypothetical protein
MSDLRDILLHLMEEVHGEPSEWPVFLVLRETLPPRLRLVIAAVATLELEGETANGLCQSLISLYRSTVDSVVMDDLFRFPPAKDHRPYRYFIRGWLRGDGSELVALHLVGSMSARITAKEPSRHDDRLRCLDEVSVLRWSGPDQIDRRAKVRPFVQPQMSKLADAYQRLRTALQQDSSTPEGLLLKDVSPLLDAIWLKHCGERALLEEKLKTASFAFGAATRKPVLTTVALSPVAEQLALLVRSVKALGQPPNAQHRELEALAGRADAAPLAVVASTQRYFAWSRDLLGEGALAPAMRESPVEFPLADSIYHQESLARTVVERAVFRDDDAAEGAWWIAARTAASLGAIAFLPELRVARAFALLRRSPPLVRDALIEVIASGTEAAVSILEELGAEDRNSLRASVSAELIGDLVSTSRSLPQPRPLREATLARTLSFLVDLNRWPDPVTTSFLDALIELAARGHQGFWKNTNARAPAIKGLLRLVQTSDWSALSSRKEALLDLLKEGLAVRADPVSRESLLEIACELSGRVDEGDRYALTSVVLTVLESWLKPEQEDWPTLFAALGFFMQRSINELVHRDTAVRNRVAEEVQRYCFREGATEQSAGWQLGLRLARSLGLSRPPEAVTVTALHFQQAETPNSSAAAGAVRRLIEDAESIEAAQVSRIIRSLSKIVGWKDSSGRFSPSINQAGIALFQLASKWEVLRHQAQSNAPEVLEAATELLGVVSKFLREGPGNPTFLAPFAFPPKTRPDVEIATTWAYGALAFGSVLGRVVEVESALDSASEKLSELREPFARARADFKAFGVSGTGAVSGEIYPQEIEGLDRDRYYASLPALIVRAARASDLVGATKAILAQCLRFGPSRADVAVLAFAASRGELRGLYTDDAILSRYRSRLAASNIDDETRRLIGFLLAGLAAP